MADASRAKDEGRGWKSSSGKVTESCHARYRNTTKKSEDKATPSQTAHQTYGQCIPDSRLTRAGHLREFRGAAILGSPLPERWWHAVHPGGEAAQAIALFLEIPLENDCDGNA